MRVVLLLWVCLAAVVAADSVDVVVLAEGHDDAGLHLRVLDVDPGHDLEEVVTVSWPGPPPAWTTAASPWRRVRLQRTAEGWRLQTDLGPPQPTLAGASEDVVVPTTAQLAAKASALAHGDDPFAVEQVAEMEAVLAPLAAEPPRQVTVLDVRGDRALVDGIAGLHPGAVRCGGQAARIIASDGRFAVIETAVPLRLGHEVLIEVPR
ncbi:MAG: hypothetical protein ACYTF0_05510 [Planctomycetota bacterium]|jgi:hypothetical protein